MESSKFGGAEPVPVRAAKWTVQHIIKLIFILRLMEFQIPCCAIESRKIKCITGIVNKCLER